MALSKSDQHFLDIMVPHHQAGIKMARDALPTSTDPGVKALLRHVIKDQGEEVKQMMEWGANPDSGSMMKTMVDKPGLGEAGHPNPLHPDPPGGLKTMGRSHPEPENDWLWGYSVQLNTVTPRWREGKRWDTVMPDQT